MPLGATLHVPHSLALVVHPERRPVHPLPLPGAEVNHCASPQRGRVGGLADLGAGLRGIRKHRRKHQHSLVEGVQHTTTRRTGCGRKQRQHSVQTGGQWLTCSALSRLSILSWLVRLMRLPPTRMQYSWALRKEVGLRPRTHVMVSSWKIVTVSARRGAHVDLQQARKERHSKVSMAT